VDRFYYYPETLWPEGNWGHWTPTLWADGRDEQTSADGDVILQWARYKDMISRHQKIASPLVMDLEVEYGDREDTATAHVQVVAEDSLAFNDLHLRLAVTESGLIYKGIYHQVLRDFVPDTLGISFVLAQGDTFTHVQDFLWDKFWIPANGRVVAFVQDDLNRDVLQAVQAPLLAPVPQQVGDVAIALDETDLRLEWMAVEADTNGLPLAIDQYRVYRDTSSVFPAAADPLAVTADTGYVDSSGVVGSPSGHYCYWVTAVAGLKESRPSGGVGAFGRGLITGK
jgi:hypothetical protein